MLLVLPKLFDLPFVIPRPYFAKALLNTVQFSQQIVSQCRCETNCRRIAQCNINMGCLATFFVVARSVAQSRTQLYFSQRVAATGNTTAVCHPSSSFSCNFTAISIRAHVHVHFSLFVPISSWYSTSQTLCASQFQP